MRSLVFGDPEKFTGQADRRILVATQGQKVGQSSIGEFAAHSGKIAAAQAEYYFDDATLARSEWLWHMKWKARMRRLSFGRQAYTCPVQDNCSLSSQPGPSLSSVLGAAVEKFTTLVRGADSIIVH